MRRDEPLRARLTALEAERGAPLETVLWRERSDGTSEARVEATGAMPEPPRASGAARRLRSGIGRSSDRPIELCDCSVDKEEDGDVPPLEASECSSESKEVPVEIDPEPQAPTPIRAATTGPPSPTPQPQQPPLPPLQPRVACTPAHSTGRRCGTPGCTKLDFHNGLCSTMTTTVRRRCGTPGCRMHDFHAGPCASWIRAVQVPRQRGWRRRRFDEEYVESGIGVWHWAQCDACNEWSQLGRQDRLPAPAETWLCTACDGQ